MSILNSGLSALGRLAAVGLLLAAFIVGLAGVVYMSLQGSEVMVPEITGKNINDSEKELAALGLKIKKRADRVSAEVPNTIIEQLPKPGETVKTGQMILVVTSKGGGEVADAPASLKNSTDEEEAEKIEELISEKPKKAKPNSNSTRKKADTARDVNASGGDSNSNSNANSSNSDSNKKVPTTGSNTIEKPNKNTQPASPRNPVSPGSRPGSDTRPRVSNRP
ncbi:MAG: PASTA domain-containing protein [Pyrinomonadaceae bacterium]